MVNYKLYGGFLFVLIGLVLSIVSMATLSWVTYSVVNMDYTVYIGLVQKRACSGSTCRTESLDCDNGGLEKLACEGGKQVIGCAIASMVVAVAGFVFAFFAHKKGKNWMRFAAVAGWFVAGVLAILSVILYSKKTVQLDYGFILYLFSSFASLVGGIIVIYGPGVTSSLS